MSLSSRVTAVLCQSETQATVSLDMRETRRTDDHNVTVARLFKVG